MPDIKILLPANKNGMILLKTYHHVFFIFHQGYQRFFHTYLPICHTYLHFIYINGFPWE